MLATLHLTSYALLELGIHNLTFNLTLLGIELISRPYLMLGIISWLVLLALTLTSTQFVQRKLGKHWQPLHNVVYVVAILAPIHYLWSIKILSPQPAVYAAVALALLALRYWKFHQWWHWFGELCGRLQNAKRAMSFACFGLIIFPDKTSI